MIDGFFQVHGYVVIESVFCTVTEEIEVRRTMKERLFTWPWRPMQRTKTETVTVPSPDVFLVGNQVIGHPATIAKLREMMQA